MENLTLFIIGSIIFLSYIFFLLRMISKQHNIQKEADSEILSPEKQSLYKNKSSN